MTTGLEPAARTGRGLRGAVVLFAGVYAAHVAVLLLSHGHLPERPATHFGPGGAANGWMSRTGYLAFLAAVPLVLAAGLWWLPRLPPRLIRLPNHAHWLAPSRREETIRRLRGHLLEFSALLTVFLAVLHGLTLHANRRVPPRLAEEALLAAVLVFLAGLGVWYRRLTVRFARPVAPPAP